jgi:phage terminase large subunit
MILLLIFMAIDITVDPYLNPNYRDFYRAADREIWLYGGANSGKSYAIADKLLIQQLYQYEKKQIKVLVMRKTMPSLKKSALDILETRADDLSLPFDLNKQDWEARSGNVLFLFLSLNYKEDYTKLQSMTNIDIVWMNELLEFRNTDYKEVLRRLRGGESDFTQLIADFNPKDKFSWVHEWGWESPLGKRIWKSHRIIYDNHPDYLNTDKGKAEINELKRYENVDTNQYRIYFLGEWGSLEGVIFNWDIVELPDIRFDEIIYGGDFGYTVDPAALVRVYRKADEFWLEEVLYKTGLTNQQLAKRMDQENIPYHADQYWDSAEPKSIQELKDAGFNAKPSRKGKDSVRKGVDCLLSKNIHIVDGSENLIKESKRYTWKTDKDGHSLNVPIEDNDHLMSAIRYAIYTRYGRKQSQPARPATVDVRSWA